MDIPTSVLKLPNSHPEHLCQLCMLWEFSNLSSFLSFSLDLNIAWIPGNWHNFLFFFPWRPKNRDLEWLDFTPVLALNKPWKLKHITLWCSSSLGLFSFSCPIVLPYFGSSIRTSLWQKYWFLGNCPAPSHFWDWYFCLLSLHWSLLADSIFWLYICFCSPIWWFFWKLSWISEA